MARRSFPDREHIVSLRLLSSTQAAVGTKWHDGRSTRFYEYGLFQKGAHWKIGRIQTFFSDESELVDSDVNLDELSKQPPSPLLVDSLPEGLERLFDGPCRLQTRNGPTQTHLVRAGNFEAPSGLVACDDPGEWQNGIQVLDLKVPPGRHSVELVVDEQLGMVGAARIIFDKHQKPEKRALATRAWHDPARAFRGSREGSYIIGVDTAMVGLADARAVASLSRRQRERLQNDIVEAAITERKGMTVVPISQGVNALSIDAGAGDGAYPAYWLLDGQNQPLALIFDFIDLSQSIYDQFEIPLTQLTGEVQNSQLKAKGIGIRFGAEANGQNVLKVLGRQSVDVKIKDSTGTLLFHTEDAGRMIVGEETTYYLPKQFPSATTGSLTVRWYVGHRYEFLTNHSENERP